MKVILTMFLLLFLCSSIFSQVNLVEYEYWFNNDYSGIQKVPFTPATQHSLNTNIDVTSLSDGINVLNIRYKDENNFYSSIISKVFYKNAVPLLVNNELVEYEYWFNNDYSSVQKVPFASATQHSLNTNIDVTSLSDGIHVLNIRYEDENNLYSSTISRVFYKSSTSITSNSIIGYKYWFDEDNTNSNYVLLGTPVNHLNLIEDIDMTQIEKGVHSVNFQLLDSIGLWSLVTTDTIVKNSYPIANFTFSKNENCDSTIINFSNNSVDGDTNFWDFGDGNTSTDEVPEHVYYTPGMYLASLTVTDIVTSTDSTIFQTIEITGNTYATIAPVACDSYISPSGNIYATTDTYIDTIANYLGCDSIVTLNLTINNSTNYTDIQTSCGSFMWIDGNTYNSSNNTATYILQNASGCDSIITLNLTVNPIPDNSVTQNDITLTANQDGAIYQWLDCDNGNIPIANENGQTYTATANGNYAVEVSMNGCFETSSCYAITTVGIVENTFNHDIVLYPNPTNRKITIDLGTGYDEINLIVQSLSGQTVKQNHYKNQQLLELNLDVPDGVYLISLTSNNKRAILKIVKY